MLNQSLLLISLEKAARGNEAKSRYSRGKNSIDEGLSKKFQRKTFAHVALTLYLHLSSCAEFYGVSDG